MINLEHPAFFTDGNIVKLNDDLTTTKLECVSKPVDYIRMIDEPIDLVPGANDTSNEVLHLEPGDILLTFRDWDLGPTARFYRIVVKNEQLSEYLTKLKEHRKKMQEESVKSNIDCKTECVDCTNVF